MKDGCSQIPIFSMLDAAVLHASLDSLLDKNSLIASLVREHISDITNPTGSHIPAKWFKRHQQHKHSPQIWFGDSK